MSNLEPTDVGPAVGGDRTVSETDRRHVITLLNAAHAEGVLSAAERDRRSSEAAQALVFDDLVPLTRDLVEVRPSVRYAPDSGETDQMVAIFSGVERKHQWQVRRHIGATAVFGGIELDMTEAEFEAEEITIEVFCLFGGVELKVPEGTAVDNRVVAVLGGCDTKVSPPRPGAPRVVLKGFACFGGVEVRNPKRKRRRSS